MCLYFRAQTEISESTEACGSSLIGDTQFYVCQMLQVGVVLTKFYYNFLHFSPFTLLISSE